VSIFILRIFKSSPCLKDVIARAAGRSIDMLAASASLFCHTFCLPFGYQRIQKQPYIKPSTGAAGVWAWAEVTGRILQ